MEQVKMLGALVGDIIGSTYECYNTKRMDFELYEKGARFTDDSVMTLAVAKWLIEDETHTIHYLIYCMQELGNLYPEAGYGGDSDTIACMAGAIAACMYPIPRSISERCDSLLTDDLRDIKDRFCQLITEKS